MAKASELYIVVPDTHYPKYNKPTFKALLDFLSRNKPAGLVFLGDQMDNQEVSPYTKGYAKLRIEAGTLLDNAKGFERDILRPIEKYLSKDTERIYIEGNHDDWIQQLINQQPELDGFQTYDILDLKNKGWKHIECGKHFRKGKLTFLHGETISGCGNQNPAGTAKKALELYATNIIFGHFHSPQMNTKVLPFDAKEKWQAYVSPVLADCNPSYLRHRPTAWVNGFSVVEFQSNGQFNVYLINVIDGSFSYGGVIYGKK